MPDYKKMYFTLFNAVTDALEVLQKEGNVFKTALILSQAQCSCEDMYIEANE